KAITVRAASTAEGAPISQMALGVGQEQQWSIEERSCSATATNQAPVAVATSTSLTGTSPLSVTFTGNKSYDPEGDPITYEWNFGDGSSYSAEANPVKVFTAKPGSQGVGLVLNYTVQLMVIDSKGLRSPVQTFFVRLNNNNPTVQITNPVSNAKYPLDKSTSYTLGATVTGNSIQSQIWQVKLRHNNREQLVKTTSGANPVVDISPVGCDGDDYYYVITVRVTDLNNLSGQDSVRIYPDCNSPKLTVTGVTATTLSSSSVRLNWTNPTHPFDKVLVVGRAGLGLTDIPLEPTYTANPSFTGNGSDLSGGGKVLYQGTSNSVVVTDLTAGQLYYFRVYAHAGNGWSGGVEVNATPLSAPSSSPGSVSVVEANKCYRLVSRLSGKVLAV
ncbi:PKD domain-containing protein, partial [Spirosoma luteum]|uniref:PKD domain-containing protein n=1 Tax=Spirosoma luteum TaxID=431553 RepID=UPI00058B1613